MESEMGLAFDCLYDVYFETGAVDVDNHPAPPVVSGYHLRQVGREKF